MEKNLEVKVLSFKIKFIKDNIKNEELKGNEKYINPEEIIYEETKENKRESMINQCKRDSYESFNETTFNKNFISKTSIISLYFIFLSDISPLIPNNTNKSLVMLL